MGVSSRAKLSRICMIAMIASSGKSLFAQIDLSGDWAVRIHEDQHWRGPGAELGEYEGIPLNEAGRLRASSWNASINTLPERQCEPLLADDFYGAPTASWNREMFIDAIYADLSRPKAN